MRVVLPLLALVTGCTWPKDQTGKDTASIEDTDSGDTDGPVDGDADGAAADVDCDDADPEVHPGAPEVPADGRDNDCDGLEHCFDDDDGDGYLDASGDTRSSDDADCADANEAGADAPQTDCDDTNGAVNPGADDVPDNGLDEDCDGASAYTPRATTPVALGPDHYTWPGRFDRFLDQAGDACEAPIVASVGAALCYVDTADRLLCAGELWSTEATFGLEFVDTGLTGVDQVFVGLTRMLAVADGVLYTFGSNRRGALGAGEAEDVLTLTPWALPQAVVGVASIANAVCALDEVGSAWCAGFRYEDTPTEQTGPYTRFGASGSVLALDDPDAYALVSEYGEVVRAAGLDDGSAFTFGEPGRIASAGYGVVEADALIEWFCWVDDDAAYRCASVDEREPDVVVEQTPFDFPAVWASVSSAGARYAIDREGAMWAVGPNTYGEVGNGTLDALTEPTAILPAGTFDLRCR